MAKKQAVDLSQFRGKFKYSEEGFRMYKWYISS